MVAAVLPWPSRSERREQVERARIEAEHAQQQAEHARGLITDLRELRKKNHVKEALDMIIQHRERHAGQ